MSYLIGIFIVYIAGFLFYVFAVEQYKEARRNNEKAKAVLADIREQLNDSREHTIRTHQSLREAQEMRRQASAILSFVQQKTSVGRVYSDEGKNQ